MIYDGSLFFIVSLQDGDVLAAEMPIVLPAARLCMGAVW